MKIQILRSYFYFIIRIVVPLAILPLLSFRLNVPDMGIVLASLSLGLLCSLIVQFGFHQSGPREIAIAQEIEDKKLIVSQIVSTQLITLLLALLLCVTLAFLTPGINENKHAVIAAMVVTLGIGCSPAWYYRGTDRSDLGIAFDMLGQIFVLFIIIVFARGSFALTLSLYAVGIGPFIATSLGLLKMIRELDGGINISLSNTMHRMRGNIPLFAIRASSTGLTTGATWLVALLTNPADAAFFGVAARLVGAMTTFSQPVVFALLPDIARTSVKSKREALKKSRKYGLILIFLGFMAVFCTYFLAEFVIMLLFDQNMIPAVNITIWLSLLCVLSFSKDALGDLTLVPFSQDKSVAIGVVSGAIAALLLAVLLTPAWGAYGMVFARLGGECVTVFVLAIYTFRFIRRGC